MKMRYIISGLIFVFMLSVTMYGAMADDVLVIYPYGQGSYPTGVNTTNITAEYITATGDVSANSFLGNIDWGYIQNSPVLVNGTNGIDGINGTNGLDGVNGINGTNGLSTNLSVFDNADGTFLWQFFYSNGFNYLNFTTSNLTGIQGVQGIAGVNGTDGVDGVNGTNGINGVNGTNGIDGVNGTNGIDGTNASVVSGDDFMIVNNGVITWNSTKGDLTYYLLSNPSGFLNGVGVVSAVGNWSLDKSLYNTTSQLNTLYLQSYTETDPIYATENSSIARVGNCPSGEFVVNATNGGVQCALPSTVAETDPIFSGENSTIWAGINNKVNGSGNATYIPIFTGEKSVGNSIIMQNENTIDAIRSDSSNSLLLTVYGANTTNLPAFIGRIARGTESSPSTILDGDILSVFSGRGYDGSAFTTGRAWMSIVSEGDWNATSNPTSLRFRTTNLDSITPMENMRITKEGTVEIGYYSSGNYTQFDTTGSMLAFGSARKYRSRELGEYNIFGISTTIDGSTYEASAKALLGPYRYVTFANTVSSTPVGNAAAFQFEIPRDIVYNSSFIVHLHLMKPDANSGNTKWSLQYRYACENEVMSPQSIYDVSLSTIIPVAGSQYNMTEYDWVVTPGLDLRSCSVAFIIGRDGEDALDTYGADMYLNMGEIIYLTDKIGSDSYD